MEIKLYKKDVITLDGRMDEPVWDSLKTYTDFCHKKISGGRRATVQTSFKILPCEDRIYIGIRCDEPDMKYVTKVNPSLVMWTCDDVEVFLAPSGNGFDFYQFAVSFEGETAQYFRSEKGNIQPDRYAPDWNYAIYKGDDHWSVEIELPLTAFYMTPTDLWSDTWLVNVSRTRTYFDNNTAKRSTSAWCMVNRTSLESDVYQPIEGFPMRPEEDDLRIAAVSVEISEETENGFEGTMTVKTANLHGADFEFSSDATESITVHLNAGDNEFTLPCRFAECKRHNVAVQLKRLSDNRVFKRYYPVRIAYEAIKLEFTKPEFRTNFYPGQDYSEVVGRVICSKPVTLRLEGAGIETQEITAAADGSFRFDTANMEEGEALLTVAGAGKVITKKIRRLAPSKHMMSWISDGKVIVNGKPVFPRTFTAVYWHGGEAFKEKYDADNLHETRFITHQEGRLDPDWVLKQNGLSPSEATLDAYPREEIFRNIDKRIEEHKDKDFAYYYLSDEPECRNISPVCLKHMYEYICEKDPYHLVRIASRAADTYIDAADFFETHPYVNAYTDDEGKRIYGRPFNTIGKYVDDIAKLNRSDKSIGFYGTCFAAVATMKDPYLSFDEFICNSWTGLIRGAKSLRQYAYHDLDDRAAMYEGSRYVFSGVEALEKYLLHADRTTIQKSGDTECALYELDGEKMFVLVNFTQEPQTVKLDQLAGTWHHFRHGETISGPEFTMKPVEVIIGTSHVKDKNLPSYQETAALIDKLEAERVNSGSLLFEREKDVKITSSGTQGGYRKLFDGIRDNYAWCQISDGDKFYEVDISKVKPAFNKVVISGYHIDDMDLKVRNGDELTVPAIFEVKTEKFSTTFILGETINPDALRLEFHQKKVELYEIEVFKV